MIENSMKTVNELMLECAKTIAFECSRRTQCKGCVFYNGGVDNCSFDSEGTPEQWTVPLDAIARLTEKV